jgi:hypothetical protein
MVGKAFWRASRIVVDPGGLNTFMPLDNDVIVLWIARRPTGSISPVCRRLRQTKPRPTAGTLAAA